MRQNRPRSSVCIAQHVLTPGVVLRDHKNAIQDNGTICGDSTSESYLQASSSAYGNICTYINKFSPLHRSRNNDDEGEIGSNKSQSTNEQNTSFLADRIQNADPLEIRLDATLASIYGFCRFLIFDITTGAKDHPGWEFKDVLWLLQTSSSAILLAALWTGAGLITRIFEDGSYEVNILKVLGTVVLAAPIWLLLEIQFGWPPAGLLYAEGADDVITLVLTGSVGLCSVMLLGKYLTSGWR